MQWKTGPGYRSAELNVATNGHTGFTLLNPAQTGITFSNRLADASIARNRIYEIGSGVALGDVDGDGWCDIYFCRSEGDNVLYRNLGDWKFEDITEKAGVACPNQYSTGAFLPTLMATATSTCSSTRSAKALALFSMTAKGISPNSPPRAWCAASAALPWPLPTSMAMVTDLYVTNYRTDTYKDHPPASTSKAEWKWKIGRLAC